MDQRIGKSDHTSLVQRLRIPESPGPVHAGKRKERSPSVLILFKEGDHTLGRFFIIGNDILNTAAERRLYGDLILLIRFDQSFFFITVRHDPADAVPIPVIALGNILQRLQTRRLPVVSSLSDPQLLLFLIQFLLIRLYLLFVFRDLFIILPDRSPDSVQFALVFFQSLQQSLRFF